MAVPSEMVGEAALRVAAPVLIIKEIQALSSKKWTGLRSRPVKAKRCALMGEGASRAGAYLSCQGCGLERWQIEYFQLASAQLQPAGLLQLLQNLIGGLAR